MAAIMRHENWKRPEDIRQLFSALGMGEFNMPMAIQYAFLLPRTSDPYAPGVMMIIKGLQRTLNRRGTDLVIDGGLGPKTARAIEVVGGPDWRNKTWVQLAGDVLASRAVIPPRPVGVSLAHEGLSGTFVGDLFASPLPLIAAGFGVWWWLKKR